MTLYPDRLSDIERRDSMSLTRTGRIAYRVGSIRYFSPVAFLS